MVLRDNVNRHFWLSQQIFIYHIHILNKAINLETGSIYKPVLKRGIPATSEYFTCRISYTIDNKVNNNLQFTKNLNFLTTFFITLVINCGLSFVFNTRIYTHTYTHANTIPQQILETMLILAIISKSCKYQLRNYILGTSSHLTNRL